MMSHSSHNNAGNYELHFTWNKTGSVKLRGVFDVTQLISSSSRTGTQVSGSNITGSHHSATQRPDSHSC